MAGDIARLILTVDADKVDAATAALGKLGLAAEKVTIQNDKQTLSEAKKAAALQKTIAQTRLAEAQIAKLSSQTDKYSTSAQQGAAKAQNFYAVVNQFVGMDGPIGSIMRMGLAMQGLRFAFSGIGTAVSMAWSVVEPFIENASKLESMTATYSALLGSAESGAGMVGYLKQLSTTLPVTMDAMSNGTKTLLGFGFAANEVKAVLPKIAALAMGNSEAFNHLAVVYGQVRAQGKMYMNDLRQFTNAGVPMIEALADVMKAPQSEIGTMIRNGQVGLTQVQASLELITAEGGRFHDTLTAAADTLNGQLTIAANNFKQIFADTGTVPANLAKNWLKGFNELMAHTRVSNKLRDLGEGKGTKQEAIDTIAETRGIISNLKQDTSAGPIAGWMAQSYEDKILDVYAVPKFKLTAPRSEVTENQNIGPQPDSVVSSRALAKQQLLFTGAKNQQAYPGATEMGFDYNKAITDATTDIINELVTMNPDMLSSGEAYIDAPGLASPTILKLRQNLVAAYDKKGKKGGEKDRYQEALNAYIAAHYSQIQEGTEEQQNLVAEQGPSFTSLDSIQQQIELEVQNTNEDWQLTRNFLKKAQEIALDEKLSVQDMTIRATNDVNKIGGTLYREAKPIDLNAKFKQLYGSQTLQSMDSDYAVLGANRNAYYEPGTPEYAALTEKQNAMVPQIQKTKKYGYGGAATYTGATGNTTTEDMRASLIAMEDTQRTLSGTQEGTDMAAPIAKLRQELELTESVSAGFAKSMMKVGDELANMMTSGYISGAKALGQAFRDGSDGAEALGDALVSTLANTMDAISSLLLEAGLQACIAGNWTLGLAMIAASGLMSFASGWVDGGETDDEDDDDSTQDYIDEMYKYYVAAEAFNREGYKSSALSGFADGTDSAPGGWSWVGERGRELMYIPEGSTVIPHEKTGGYANGVGTAGGTSVVVNNNASGTTATAEETTDALGMRTVQVSIEKVVQNMAAKGKLKTALAVGSNTNRRISN